MAKKQTRRSVSIRGATYEKIRAYCEKHSLSMSEFVEDLIGQFFSGNGATLSRPTAAAAPEPKRKTPMTAEEKLDFDEMQDAARFFTF
jgi:hypothetical protein